MRLGETFLDFLRLEFFEDRSREIGLSAAINDDGSTPSNSSGSGSATHHTVPPHSRCDATPPCAIFHNHFLLRAKSMVEVASTSNLGRAARTSVAEVKVLGLQHLLLYFLEISSFHSRSLNDSHRSRNLKRKSIVLNAVLITVTTFTFVYSEIVHVPRMALLRPSRMLLGQQPHSRLAIFSAIPFLCLDTATSVKIQFS